MIEIKRLCNKCGKEIDKLDWECNPFSLEHQFGYGSGYDMLNLQLDLCSTCQDSIATYLIKNCKISPIVEDSCQRVFKKGSM